MGTYSEFCSRTCEREATYRTSRAEHTAHRSERVVQSARVETLPGAPRQKRARTSKPLGYRAPQERIERSAFAAGSIAARGARGWSRADLARQMAVSLNTIENWENGRVTPPSDRLAQMADIFGISMDDLWRGTAHLRAERRAS